MSLAPPKKVKKKKVKICRASQAIYFSAILGEKVEKAFNGIGNANARSGCLDPPSLTHKQRSI